VSTHPSTCDSSGMAEWISVKFFIGEFH
jgi:hypothetical protein